MHVSAQIVAFFSPLLGLVSAVAAAPAASTSGNWVAHDLGTLGGDNSFARDINDAGRIVGESGTAAGETHAFVYIPETGGMRDLGTLGGNRSMAVAISNSGVVVGVSSANSSNYCGRAMMWDSYNGQSSILPDLDPSNPYGCSNPSDVNDQRIVVGSSGDYAVRWVHGAVISFGVEGYAKAINERNQVLIWNRIENRDYLWENDVLTPIPDYSGTSSALQINVVGQIAGYTPSGSYPGWILDRGVFTQLASLGGSSLPFGINNQGDVVGQGDDSSYSVSSAVLWTADGHRTVNLGSLLQGCTFSAAFGINAKRTVVGVAYLNDRMHAIQWVETGAP